MPFLPHLSCTECGQFARWRCRVDGTILCAPHTTDHLTEFFDHTLIDLDDPAALHQVMAELAAAAIVTDNLDPLADDNPLIIDAPLYTFPVLPPWPQLFAADMFRALTSDDDRRRLEEYVQTNLTQEAWEDNDAASAHRAELAAALDTIYPLHTIRAPADHLTPRARAAIARQIAEYERSTLPHDDQLDTTRGLVSHAEHDPITVTFLQGSPLYFVKAFDPTIVHVTEEQSGKYLCGRFSQTHWNPADVLSETTRNLATMCQRCVLAIMRRYPLFTRWHDAAGNEVTFIDDAWQTLDSLRQRDDHCT